MELGTGNLLASFNLLTKLKSKSCTRELPSIYSCCLLLLTRKMEHQMKVLLLKLTSLE